MEDPTPLFQASICVDEWGLPSQVATELIGLFLETAQAFLTFVHPTTFIRRFMRQVGEKQKLIEPEAVSNDEAFMIYSMLAVATRFSKSSYFDNVPPASRDDILTRRASALKDSILKNIQEPSLDFVEACVILAFHHLSAGRIGPGSVLISVCIRFAYDLSLDVIDDDGNLFTVVDGCAEKRVEDNSESWLKKEECRRLWWSIWELDIFISTLSIHPYGIARGEIKVLLPAPNDNWLRGVPTQSAFIHHHCESTWKSLINCPNQSARSWFLVANHIKSDIILHARRLSGTSAASKQMLEMNLCNFKLSLPSDFQLRSLYFTDDNQEQNNWIVAIHLIIATCETILERSSCHREDDYNLTWNPTTQGNALFSKRITSYIYQVGQVWTAEFIRYCHPFISCAVMVPSCTDVYDSELAIQGREVARLIMTHIAQYWGLGSTMLRLLSFIEQGVDTEIDPPARKERQALLKQYSVLLPSMSRRKVSHDGRPEKLPDQDPVIQLSTTGSATTSHQVFNDDGITAVPQAQNAMDSQTDLTSMHPLGCHLDIVPATCDLAGQVFL
ncbi:hypothetical protein PV10_08046 [Exophiala mesophila]|uniref:Xylanolytic transcriptional activator regulatory domain-containing protein n=1 Tax=Exophiala mesophila TaxID=212818 RepID=A0A0D1WHQ5_EXOME|nr:uncharacterized protein PV10_08046 [Exophiala mesophila]KIV88355.1 hypothetical protein PV10_08046 [Exophiala mesophila]